MTTTDFIQGIELLKTPAYRRLLAQCIHCGLCLQACPTYTIFGTEMDAPRGRIALMRAAAEGRIGLEDFQDSFTGHIQLCLACRACETACPSGVHYGALVEQARIVVEQNRLARQSITERALRWLGAKQLMPHPGRIKLLARLLYAYQVTGLQKLFRALNFLPQTLKAMEGILPPIQLKFTPVGKMLPALHSQKRGRVLFFTGCIQEGFLAAVNQATIHVLQYNGYEVYAPAGQTCCGAAHLHLGDIQEARRLARQNIDTFLSQDGSFEAIICNAGGCGVSLKEYEQLLADDIEYKAKAQQFSAQVKDISEFLFDHLHTMPTGEIKARVTYADSCHLRHGQKVVHQPRELLKKIPGLEYVELSQPDRCCGSAGVYNITQVETANQILEAKMADIAATGADLIVTTNTGCQMQLIAGVRRTGLQARVVHLVELLEASYHAR